MYVLYTINCIYACRNLYTKSNMETLDSHVLLTIYSAAMMPSMMAQKKQEITPRLMKMMEDTNCKKKNKQTWMDQKLKNKARTYNSVWRQDAPVILTHACYVIQVIMLLSKAYIIIHTILIAIFWYLTILLNLLHMI